MPDLGLQPPPCRSHAAHQGFYLGGQIAPLLLRLLQEQWLRSEARRHGLRPLIRYCVGSVGRLRLLCSRGNLRLDWLLPAASRREPDSGWVGAAGVAPGTAERDRRGARGVPVGPEPGTQWLQCGRRAPAGD